MTASRHSRNRRTWLPALLLVVLAVAAGAAWMLLEETPEAVPEPRRVEAGPTPPPPAMEIVAPPENDHPSRIAVPAHVAVADAIDFTEDELENTSRIEGLVLDTLNRPVAGAVLHLYKGHPLVDFPGTRQRLPVSTVADASGAFVLDPVPAGKDFVIVGEHPDFAESEISNLRVKNARPLEGIVLRMDLGATVSGQVVSMDDVPLPEARVELYDSMLAATRPEDQRPWKIAMTDTTGAFAFEHVSAANVKLRVEVPGYESQTRTLSYALEARPKDQRVDFQLRPGDSLDGQVIDDQGQVVVGARIEATSLTKTFQGTAVAFSGAGGQFTLEGMSTDNHYQVRAYAEGYSDHIQPRVHVDDGHIMVEMKRQVAVEGWVTNLEGSPVPHFSLTLLRANPGRPNMVLNDTRTFRTEDGAFVFDNIDPGNYALEARSRDYAPSQSVMFTLTREDQARPSITITMGRGGTLTGTVYGVDGQALPRALVAVNENNYVDSPLNGIFGALSPVAEVKIEARTDAEGTFRVEHITPGVYQISARHPSAAPFILNDVTVVDDALGKNPPLALEMPPGAVVAGRALDSNRQPMAFAEVTISQPSGLTEVATTDGRGTFSFDNLSEGKYSLHLSPARGADNKPLNPLLRLVHAQKSRIDLFVREGQVIDDLEVYLRDSIGSNSN